MKWGLWADVPRSNIERIRAGYPGISLAAILAAVRKEIQADVLQATDLAYTTALRVSVYWREEPSQEIKDRFRQLFPDALPEPHPESAEQMRIGSAPEPSSLPPKDTSPELPLS